MKLSISLLVLAALGQAASQLVKPKSSAASPTTKRELLEGNFGQKTKFVNKYAAPQASPGIQYADDFKQDSIPPNHQLFGARLPPISKISDLLSGQGPPFEAALANHLYAPVSVYNSKLAAFNLFEVPSAAATKNVFSDSKIFKQQKSQSEKGNQQLQHQSIKQAPAQHGPPFPYNEPNIGSRTTPFSPSFSSGFDPNYPQELFQQQSAFSGRLSPHLIPLSEGKPSFKFSLKDQSTNHALQYYHLQSPAQYVPVTVGSYHDNQEESGENKDNSKKEGKLLKVEQLNRPEEQQQQQRYIPKQAYHAHPNGAISYASFTNNQGSFERQPEAQVQYKQLSQIQQQQDETQSRHAQPIYVPDVVQTGGQPEEQTLAPLEHQQQYIQVQQQQYLQRPSEQQILLQHIPNPEKSAVPQFIDITQPHQNQLYLNPIRQKLLRELQHGSIPQSLDYQQQTTLRTLPTTGSKFESLGQSTTHSPLTHQPTLQPFRHAYYPVQQDTVHILPARHYTPLPATVTYRQSVKPSNSHPATLEPQYTVTPKSDTEPDQLLQPTTVEPEVSSDNQRDGQAQQRSTNHQSSTLLPPQSTLQPLLASPETLQSLSTFQPSGYSSSSTPRPESLSGAPRSHKTPHHLVQIQQQELHEIHSELAPGVRQQHQPGNHNKLEPQEHEHKVQETTPHQYQSQRGSTPQPTETPKPDYEIEISSQVDHSQLPKELQPVQQEQNDHEETQHQVEQTQPQLEQPHQDTQPEHEQRQQVESPARTQTFLSHEGIHPSTLQHPVSFDPSAVFYNPDLSLQPILRPQVFSNGQEFVLQPNFPQSHAPSFPPVQYYGKFAESIFGGFRRRRYIV